MNFVVQEGTDPNRDQNTGEHNPVGYPRSDKDRALSNNNKGGASVDAGPGVVDYTAGPYPKIADEADNEGSGTA